MRVVVERFRVGEVQGSGFRVGEVQGSGLGRFRVQGLGLGGSGFRVGRFRVQGSGFKVGEVFLMKIERFEDIEAWKLARDLTKKIYKLTSRTKFYQDGELRRQLRRASGSAMHNTAEGFDSETNPEFIRFLRYSKRSCTEIQSELYVALDQNYITEEEFKEIYSDASRTRAAIYGFITYLKNYEQNKKQTTTLNPEP